MGQFQAQVLNLRSNDELQAQEARRIRREEEFSDLRAAASYRRVGEKHLARALLEHSRQWRLMSQFSL